MQRSSILYLVILTVVGSSILWILHAGADLPAPEGVPMVADKKPPGAADLPATSAMLANLSEHLHGPLSHLFVQLIVIISASLLVGQIFTRCGQPAVVGEMAAGILLGPSLFGWVSPEAFAFVFPVASLDTLKMLSQVGVCLFMFAVGMELNTGLMRGKAQAAIVVSHASIVIPYLLGVILA